MNSETEKIRKRYEKRKLNPCFKLDYFDYYARCEKEIKYYEILSNHFDVLDDKLMIEIGSGIGSNLHFFKRIGIRAENIYANELMADRGEILKREFASSHIHIGDAMNLNYNSKFDIVFQSLVFTSILDMDFKKNLAEKMFSMVKKEGLILWYDFKYNNPKNPDVKGIKKKEIIQLFPKNKRIQFHNVTLAPPIGRKVGKFYNFINIFSPLRTHIIAEIYK